MLSFVKALDPTIVLIENVTGLLAHSAAGIEMATVKLICRCLTVLGYQVCFKVLQAGQYGDPQDRERLIFLAARHGRKLPEFPILTHAFPKAARQWKIPIRKSDRIRPPKRTLGEEHLFAPHPAVTVNDAISDLPAFEWINPHRRIMQTQKNVTERKQRALDGISQFNVSRIPVGFVDPVPYRTKPQTRYQSMMRRGHGSLVDHHVTQAFSDLVVESTTLVPLRPWSNHRFLPPNILPQRMKRPGDSTNFYGRLDASSYFKTAMTAPKPDGNNSYFIHPTQRRALTLREFARSQGFPDSYVLCSAKSRASAQLKDYFKQIGNAVPFCLAVALGRSFGVVSAYEWRRHRRQEENSVEG
ncbi:Multifunctional fusion protein [Mycena venus]|uniref:DNA (cytosine-5-)-methyltransferase n=1 Tax=Mycena venus TaxID=2733690 RepID=A0A8H6X4V1_9AGAR|nr:Multifunctional fusion protein [Mycena venus]